MSFEFGVNKHVISESTLQEEFTGAVLAGKVLDASVSDEMALNEIRGKLNLFAF